VERSATSGPCEKGAWEWRIFWIFHEDFAGVQDFQNLGLPDTALGKTDDSMLSPLDSST
jgi:hypothetical protein